MATVNNVLAWQVDTASIAAVQAANATVSASLQGVAASASTVAQQMAAAGATAQEIFDATGETIDTGLTAPLNAASQSTQNLIRDIGDLGRDIEAIPEPDLSAFGVADDVASGGGGGGSGFGNTRAIASLGSLAGSQAGGGNVRDVASIVRLTSAFGEVGFAAGAFALVLNAVTAGEQAATKAGTDYEQKLQGIAQSLAGGATSQDIQKTIDGLQTQLKLQTQNRDSLQELQDQFNNTAKAEDKGYISLQTYSDTITLLDQQTSKLTGGAIEHVNQIGGTIGASQSIINDIVEAIALYNAALHSQQVADNNAAAALDALSKKQEAGAAQALQIDQLTDAQLKERADSDQRQVNVLTRYVGANNLTGDALTSVANQITALNADYALVTAASGTYGEQLEAEAKAKQDAIDNTNNYLDAITKENDAIQKVSQAQQDLAQALIDHNAAIDQIQADERGKEAQDRADAAAQAEEDEQKHLDKLAQIDAQANADHEADVGNRDALKNYQDAQKAALDTAKEDQSFAKQEAQNQQHLAKQLQQDQQAEQKQEQSENISYNKRYQQLVQALNNAQVEESRAAGLALGYQRQANDAQLNETIVSYNNILFNTSYFLGQLTGQFLGAYTNILSNGSSGGSNGGSGGGFGFGNQLSTQSVNRIVDRRVAQMVRQAGL